MALSSRCVTGHFGKVVIWSGGQVVLPLSTHADPTSPPCQLAPHHAECMARPSALRPVSSLRTMRNRKGGHVMKKLLATLALAAAALIAGCASMDKSATAPDYHALVASADRTPEH